MIGSMCFSDSFWKDNERETPLFLILRVPDPLCPYHLSFAFFLCSDSNRQQQMTTTKPPIVPRAAFFLNSPSPAPAPPPQKKDEGREGREMSRGPILLTLMHENTLGRENGEGRGIITRCHYGSSSAACWLRWMWGGGGGGRGCITTPPPPWSPAASTENSRTEPLSSILEPPSTV